MNPFAKALQRASHILVIPNSKISIYSRLWCVYEAYLGTTMEKICLMRSIGTIHRTPLRVIVQANTAMPQTDDT